MVGTGFTPVKADLLVPGCASTPMFPHSRVPFDLVHQLVFVDGASVDFSDARLVVTGQSSGLLKGADLRAVKLAGASFLGFPANLEGATFDGALLQGTHFDLADLSGATFVGATAPGATFNGAELDGAKFVGLAHLEGADFIQADISGANFQTANITGASFDQALAVGTDFGSVIGDSASFVGAHIYGDSRRSRARAR